MTTGSVNVNATTQYPSGYQGSPWYRKEWDGANSADHKSFNDYTMCKVVAEHRQCRQSNLYYPFDPPYYYVTRGLPNWSALIGERDTYNGNTALKAQAEALEAIRNHDFYAGSALAEPDETLTQLVNSSKAAMGFARSALTGKWSEAARHLGRVAIPPRKLQKGFRDMKKQYESGDVSGLWLSMQFGWLPLISSVYDAIDAFDGAAEGLSSTVYTGRASAPAVTKRFDVGGSTATVYGTVFETYTARVVVRPTIDPWTLAGFNKETWLSVAWERIPFSFVFDWFIPIGSMLENWSSLSNFATSIHETRFKRIVGGSPSTLIDESKPPNVAPNNAWTPGRSSWEAVTLVRRTLPAGTMVIPSVKPLHKSLSSGHLKNAAALVYSLSKDSKHQVLRHLGAGGLLSLSL